MSSSRSSSADSKSRSRSRSKSKSPDRRSRSRSRSRSVSVEDIRHCRLHIGEIGNEVGKRDLERAFEKYGKIAEIWVARYPPMFAFVVFKRISEAEEAMKACNGLTINGTRITVSEARPRRESRDVASGKGIRCYQCGRTGHFARDCIGSLYGYRRPPSRSPDRRRRQRSRSPNGGGGGYSSRRGGGGGRDRDYQRGDRDRGDRGGDRGDRGGDRGDRGDRDRERDRGGDRDRDRRGGGGDRERDRDRDSRR